MAGPLTDDDVRHRPRVLAGEVPEEEALDGAGHAEGVGEEADVGQGDGAQRAEAVRAGGRPRAEHDVQQVTDLVQGGSSRRRGVT